MTISFYSTRDAHGGFSNFSRHGFTLKGLWWPTSEHYFQAQKFAGTEHEEAVRRARTPKEAAELGRDRRRPLRADWEQVKDDVMRDAVRAKFLAHVDLRAELLATGDKELVENAPGDYYWGCGVFRNDPTEVAGLFATALAGPFRGAFAKVVFAVLDSSPERRFIGPFERAFPE